MPEEKEVKRAPIVSKRQDAKAGDFTLNAAYWLMECSPATAIVDVRDTYWAETLLGTHPSKLNDLAGIFLRSHGVYADERDSWGPPKWQYDPTDPTDSFDHYVLQGCKCVPFLVSHHPSSFLQVPTVGPPSTWTSQSIWPVLSSPFRCSFVKLVATGPVQVSPAVPGTALMASMTFSSQYTMTRRASRLWTGSVSQWPRRTRQRVLCTYEELAEFMTLVRTSRSGGRSTICLQSTARRQHSRWLPHRTC